MCSVNEDHSREEKSFKVERGTSTSAKKLFEISTESDSEKFGLA